MPIKPDVIERAIATAQAQTAGIRATVWHHPMVGNGPFGPVYGDWTELSDDLAPLIEEVGEGVPTAQGTEAISKTKLTFFYSLKVTDRDQFRIGERPEELNVMKQKGLLKPDHTPYMVEVWLGDRPSGDS